MPRRSSRSRVEIPTKTRTKIQPVPGNQNRVILEGFSNPESEKQYRRIWPTEPKVREFWMHGRQCGSCTWYAPFDLRWGLCCCPTSRHRTETVYELFTCPHQDEEGREAHSFRPRDERTSVTIRVTTRQDLTDERGRLLGYIEDRGSEQFGYDRHGAPIGRYDKRKNATYDQYGGQLGTGNLLATFITRN